MLCNQFYKTKLTFAIGIFALTESINERSISATAMPVDSLSENEQRKGTNVVIVVDESTLIPIM